MTRLALRLATRSRRGALVALLGALLLPGAAAFATTNPYDPLVLYGEFKTRCSAERARMLAEWDRMGHQNGPYELGFYEEISKMDTAAVQERIRGYAGLVPGKPIRRSDSPADRATNDWEDCLLRTRLRQLAPEQDGRGERDGAAAGDGRGAPPRSRRAELQEGLSDQVANCRDSQGRMVERLRSNRPRRSHPELNATDCIRPDEGPGLYGGFFNDCTYDVVFSYCAHRPKKDSWATSFDCEKQQFGTLEAKAQAWVTAHTHGAEAIHWVACRSPEASPTDLEFSPGSGLEFRCYEWGEGDPPREFDEQNLVACEPQLFTMLPDLFRAEQEQLAEERRAAASEAKRWPLAEEANRRSDPRQGSQELSRPTRTSRASPKCAVDELNQVLRPFMETVFHRTWGLSNGSWNEQQLWDRAYFGQALRRLPNCVEWIAENPGATDLSDLQQYCRNSEQQIQSSAYSNRKNAPFDCVSGRNYMTDVEKQEMEAALQRFLGAAGHRGEQRADEAVPSTCQQGIDSLTAEFEAINRRKPATADLVSQLQATMYMTGKYADHLESACRGMPQYSEYDSYRRSYDQAVRTCRASASNAELCVAKLAW